MLPKKLQSKLEVRRENLSLRQLTTNENLVDFSSNDYLGFAKDRLIFDRAGRILKEHDLIQNGATGSRLLSGNHKIYKLAEDFLSEMHHVEAALVFNSGYDANVGFFSSVPQRGDIILYDELIHASIRDGMQMGLAKAYKFKHNDPGDLEKKLGSWSQPKRQDEMLKQVQHDSVVYVVTESVFSMDGDSPQLQKMADLCKEYGAKLIVDEAHAVGVLGEKNLGLVEEIGLNGEVFARLVTFGKALGCHGAAILGSADLKAYLINFARSFIYTTALAPHGVATILAAYKELLSKERQPCEIQKLQNNTKTFNNQLKTLKLQSLFIKSDSAIQSAIIPGNNRAKTLSRKLKKEGFDVKAILSPTVPAGRERLRFCLHSFNTEKEIRDVLNLLEELLKTVPHKEEDR